MNQRSFHSHWRQGRACHSDAGCTEFFTALTAIDKVNRLVTLDSFKLTKAKFPTRRGMEQAYLDALKQQLPQAARVIPPDHPEAVFVVSAAA